jgi:hypothetical protein
MNVSYHLHTLSRFTFGERALSVFG